MVLGGSCKTPHCSQDSTSYFWKLGALPAPTEKHESNLPFESKLLPAVLLLLRIYFPKVTVTVTVLKFG